MSGSKTGQEMWKVVGRSLVSESNFKNNFCPFVEKDTSDSVKGIQLAKDVTAWAPPTKKRLQLIDTH